MEERRGDSWGTRLALLAGRVAVALLAGYLLAEAPDPAAGELVPLKYALACFTTVALTGKAIYDTLFYSRYGT